MLTEKERKILIEFFSSKPLKSYSKNEIILEPNSVFRNVYFIENGMTRLFYYDSTGAEITHWFSAERDIVTVLSSALDSSKCQYGFQSLENNVNLRVISFKDFVEIKSSSKDISNIYEKLVTMSLIQVANRLVDLQTKAAKERYNDLLAEHPEIFQRANLSHIASYLGMARQSLSRIRAMK